METTLHWTCFMVTFLQVYSRSQVIPSPMNQKPVLTPSDLCIVHRITSHLGTSDTNTEQTQYENRIQYLIRFGDKDQILTLHKEHDLLTMNFTASHYHEDGSLVTETLGHLAHCCYIGSVEGLPESSASVCTCHGLSGYITLGDETYSIDSTSQSQDAEYVITKTNTHKKTNTFHHNRQRRSQHRHLKQKSWQGKYNIELFLVADKAAFQCHGENLERTRNHLLATAHHLNQILLKISFQVFLVGIEVWTQENKANVSETASSTLLHVLEWRRQALLPRKQHDNMQFISGSKFKNHALGEAFFAKMCSPNQSGGVIKDTGLSPRELAKYIAHEMGHNLGMHHDTEDCYCPATSGKCLLSGRTGHNMNEEFSDCSRRFLDRFLDEKDVTCLKDRPQTYIDEPVIHSHPYKTLEVVGKVSLVLCCLILFLVFVVLCGGRFCRRRRRRCETAHAGQKTTSWDGHLRVML
ncbi:disintegrin and metalloproteinase domain-containing protein 33 [Pelodytes ibericus]